MSDFPAWIFYYFTTTIFPMTGVINIAIKIVLKNGKDMSRELLGSQFQSFHGNPTTPKVTKISAVTLPTLQH